MSDSVENRNNYCDQCDKWFQQTSSYKVHMDKHAGKRHYCDMCDKSYTAAHSLMIHKRTHSDMRPYKCQYCEARFFQSGHCHRHEKSCHSEISVEKLSDLKEQDDPKTSKFTCKVCGKFFRRQSSYKVHLKTHDDGDNNKEIFSGCDAAVEGKTKLKTHQQVHKAKKGTRYVMKSKTKATKPVIVCRVCRRLFSCMSSYRVHEKKHKGIRHYCTRCAKSFTTYVQLKAHEKDHDSVTKYKCNQCDKSFNRRSNLARHKHLHQGVHRYVCHVCGKSFILLEGYSAHLKVHQNQPSAWCNMCGAAFKFLSSLKAHQKMHSNKKDFKCEICDREFLRKRTLEDHMKVHVKGTDRKALISTPVAFCLMCSKGFSNTNGLQRHMRKHKLGLLKTYNRIHTKNAFTSSEYLQSNCLIEKSDNVVVQTDDISDDSHGYQAIDPEYFVDTVSVDNFDGSGSISSDEDGAETLNDVDNDVVNHVEGISLNNLNVDTAASNLYNSHDKDTCANKVIDYNNKISIGKLKEMYTGNDTLEKVEPINNVMTTPNVYIFENRSVYDGISPQLINITQNEPVRPLNNGTMDTEKSNNTRIDQMPTCHDISLNTSSGVCQDMHLTETSGDNYLEPSVTNMGSMNNFQDSVLKSNYENEKGLTNMTESSDTTTTTRASTESLPHTKPEPISIQVLETIPTYIAAAETALNANQSQYNDDSSMNDKMDGELPLRYLSKENVDKLMEIKDNQFDNEQISRNLGDEKLNHSSGNAEDSNTIMSYRESSKEFVDQLSYNNHSAKHKDDDFECHYCMSKYANQKSLKMHLSRYHPDGENKIYKCDKCSKMFASKLIYFNHVDNHRWKGTKLEKEKACDVCGDVFRSYLSYNRHMRVKHHKFNEDNYDVTLKENNGERKETDGSNLDEKNWFDNEQDNVTRRLHKEEIIMSNQDTEEGISVKKEKLDDGKNEYNLGNSETDVRNNESNLSDSGNDGVTDNTSISVRTELREKGQRPKPSTKFQRKYKCSKCDKSFYMLSSIKQHTLTHSTFDKGHNNISSNHNAAKDTSTKCSNASVNCDKGHIEVYIDVDVEEAGGSRNKRVNLQVKDKNDRSSKLDSEETTDLLNDTEEQRGHASDRTTMSVKEKHIAEDFSINQDDLKESLSTDEESCENGRPLTNEKKQQRKKIESSTSFKCRECEEQFVTHSEKLQHVKTVHGDQFLCEHCPKKFCTLTNLKRHMDIHHASNDGTVSKNYMCTECGKCFTASDTLRIHMFTHTGERPYKCKHCDASYTQSGHLQRHVRTAHTRQSTYVCKHKGCQKGFYDQSRLSMHEKTHSDFRQYQCNMCPKHFKTSDVLKKHMKTHQDTKDFECHICYQTLATKHCLKRHLQRHVATEKMDPCSVKYDPNFNAKVRQQTVKKMEDKKFQCESCMNKFTTTRGLLSHQRKFCKGRHYGYLVVIS